MIVELIGSAGSVLDVGCRDRALAGHLPPGTRYVGVDLFAPADVIASAEEPLPFRDSEFDVVVFADVLEHLNDPHSALREGLRVAQDAVVVVLPNVYALAHRLNFLRGKTWAKYAFGPDNPLDRHRWIMNFSQAEAFARGVTESAGWHLARTLAYDGGFRRPAPRALINVAKRLTGPNVWAWEFAARAEPAARSSS